VAFRGVGVTGREQTVELQPTEGVKKKGLAMKKFVLSAVAALVVSSAPALAADLRMATKAPPAPAFRSRA
jgi:hypothetical protein